MKSMEGSIFPNGEKLVLTANHTKFISRLCIIIDMPKLKRDQARVLMGSVHEGGVGAFSGGNGGWRGVGTGEGSLLSRRTWVFIVTISWCDVCQ
jgi:hypothetical protein